jgi:hypothetical protein
MSDMMEKVKRRLRLDDPLPDAFKHSQIGKEMLWLYTRVLELEITVESLESERPHD